MGDPLLLTKLRMKGQQAGYSFVPDDDDEEQEKSEIDDLRQSIGDLVETVKKMAYNQTTVDLSPVMTMLHGVQSIQERMAKKRQWLFDVARDDDGEITTITATEI